MTVLDQPHYFTSPPMKTPKRLLCLPVPERFVIEAFAAAFASRKPVWSTLPECHPPVPADATVQAVHHDFMSGTFRVILYHPFFPEVADGEVIPLADVTYHSEKVDAPTVVG